MSSMLVKQLSEAELLKIQRGNERQADIIRKEHTIAEVGIRDPGPRDRVGMAV